MPLVPDPTTPVGSLPLPGAYLRNCRVGDDRLVSLYRSVSGKQAVGVQGLMRSARASRHRGGSRVSVPHNRATGPLPPSVVAPRSLTPHGVGAMMPRTSPGLCFACRPALGRFIACAYGDVRAKILDFDPVVEVPMATHGPGVGIGVAQSPSTETACLDACPVCDLRAKVRANAPLRNVDGSSCGTSVRCRVQHRRRALDRCGMR
jgi:hypothetical protein